MANTEPVAVELAQMLEARERRAFRQHELLAQFHKPLVCFTMNIAGPVKNNNLIRRGFALGNELLQGQLMAAKAKILHVEKIDEPTGNEAIYVVDIDPQELKRRTTAIEDGILLGRLFDMDVLLPSGEKVERESMGLESRRCLICDEPARACARSRKHTVPELQKKTIELLTQSLEQVDAKTIAQYAVRALLYEVCTTPKPGLVDCDNNGSHKDMDIFTFMSSAAALWPYFEECAKIGLHTASQPAPITFSALRSVGRLAEGTMLKATGGVNTHKGAIFTMGLACAALGRISSEEWKNPAKVLSECAAMTNGLVASEMAELTSENVKTAGQRFFLQYGITGARGQAEEGFPAVLNAGLPVFECGLAEGKSINDSGAAALLALIAASVDTNLISRGGLEAQQQTAEQCAEVLKETPYPDKGILSQMNTEYVEKNLSPGGSADLLSLCYLLHFMKFES